MNTQKHHPNAEKHPFEPVFDEKSRVLILGSFPPKNTSQKGGFYYADSSNRFWLVLGTLFNEPNLAEKSIDEKKSFLLKNKIALYDIWEYCHKENPNSSKDKDIKPEPDSQKADLTKLLKTATKIQKVFTTIGNSTKSKTYNKNKKHPFLKWDIESWLGKWNLKVVPLLSTSSISPYANNKAKQRGFPELFDDYKQIKTIITK